MTETERVNLVGKISTVMMRWITKERRENAIVPTGAEYMEILRAAVEEVSEGVCTPRKPGRPKKKPAAPEEADEEPEPPVVVRIARPLQLAGEVTEVVVDDCYYPTAKAWADAIMEAEIVIRPDPDPELDGIIEWSVPPDIDPDLLHRLEEDAEVWFDEAWADGPLAAYAEGYF